ncbi:SGNH/GDSL hydrolase family protein [Acinetobacter sp. WCHAc010052]|uniref:SGNH/GDSL hydrolase family protein n=1 Tax=Acinetobacter sp. WCHAc010052 TaxID=2004647 RepID=UPI000B3D2C58|nr:SGNH/GDSL hydrolase family protein [Acinetobacter sp. WCHAc010052]
MTNEIVKTVQETIQDCQHIQSFNNDEDTEKVITSRLGRQSLTMAGYIRLLMDTGGFEPFQTEVALKASRPTVAKKAAKAMDTSKIWYWNGTVWTDTGLSEFDKAVSRAQELDDEVIIAASAEADQKAATAVINANKYTDNRVGTSVSSRIIPLAVDAEGYIPVWLEEGALDFADSVVIGKASSGSLVPMAVDRDGNIPVWIKDGKLGFAGLSDEAVELLNRRYLQTKYLTSVVSLRPIVSDGTSLFQWKAKAAKIKTGAAQQLRVAITGDSWTEHSVITGELIKLLRAEYGEAGSGWINLGAERNMLDGITITYSSGWIINDMDNGAAAFPYGCGPDGFTRTSSTAGSKITLGNLSKGNELSVFFGNTGGVFSYSVNGSAETEVTVDAAQRLMINLSGTSSVVLTVKSGEICFWGMHMRKTTGAGVEVNKLGNGNCTGRDYLKISPGAQANLSEFIGADVVIIMLGTNDYRRGHSTADFANGIARIINGYRSASPGCACIVVAPAQSNVATPPIPLVDFTEMVFLLAPQIRAEYYNMYDDWAGFESENAQGQWNDNLHVSQAGAYRLAKKIYKSFLEL